MSSNRLLEGSGDPTMDNFKVEITSRYLDHLRAGMKIAFDRANLEATHFVLGEQQRDEDYCLSPFMRLFTSAQDELCKPLPYPMDCEAATEFVINWLKQVKYLKQPDHDGDNSPGFRVIKDEWNSHSEGIVTVVACWAMHGK